MKNRTKLLSGTLIFLSLAFLASCGENESIEASDVSDHGAITVSETGDDIKTENDSASDIFETAGESNAAKTAPEETESGSTFKSGENDSAGKTTDAAKNDSGDKAQNTAPKNSETEEKGSLNYYDDIFNLPAGSVITEDKINTDNLSAYFTANAIDEELKEYMTGRSYTENDDISFDDLRYIKVLHYNFDHEIQVGELVVNALIADDAVNIFRELFEAQYEIYSMYLIEEFWTGDGESSDTNSIEHNNTSAFNYRPVIGSSSLSNHALGLAIDINPLQNPYVKYNPDGSFARRYKDMELYLDRRGTAEHMITHEDTAYKIFKKYGFSWGGDWNSTKDYQHFEKT